MLVQVAYGTVFAAVVLTGFRRPSDRVIALFSEVYAVPITPINRRLVEHYVRWSRTGRLLGLVGGFGVSLVMPEDRQLLWPVVGYGLGAVLAELLRPSVPGSSATLRRRRLTDYVGSEFVVVLGLNATLVCVGLVVGLLTRTGPPVSTETLGLACASGAYLLLATVAARRIISAPQPVAGRDLDATEHAVRSSALIALVGLAYLAVGQLGVVVWQLTLDGSWRRLGAIVSVVVGLSATAGVFMTFRSLPRFAPFWRRLPQIAPAQVAS